MKNYEEEFEKTMTSLVAIEEASRCLLCEDAPCSVGCPAGTDPGRFIRSLYFKNLKGAAERIRENNILGGICAKVCPTEKYCKKACSRTGIDKPIEIGKLQNFLIDFERESNLKVIKKVALEKEKVAIIGSGPSGLTAASELAKKGYNVTIFEKQEKFGGWLRYGIPEYRLGTDILDYELNLIKEQGVEFKNNSIFGKDITVESLEKDDFKAILFATGNNKGKTLEIFKNTNTEVAVDFLSKVKTAKKMEGKKNIVIVGGGDVALDCAVTCKIFGCKNVKVVAVETLENLPASKAELETSLEMKIQIIGGFIPEKVENKKVIFKSVDGEDELSLSSDLTILAIGQTSDLDPQIKNENKKNLFFSGDIVEGEKTVVWAIKSGKEIANEIIEFLGGM